MKYDSWKADIRPVDPDPDNELHLTVNEVRNCMEVVASVLYRHAKAAAIQHNDGLYDEFSRLKADLNMLSDRLFSASNDASMHRVNASISQGEKSMAAIMSGLLKSVGTDKDPLTTVAVELMKVHYDMADELKELKDD
jgi:hypothetical protein